MSDVSASSFLRTPYTISYYKDGKKETIRRIPPPKLHPVVAGDSVTILRKKNADWDEGDEVTVTHINPRHPNVLQVENSRKQKTFLTYFDTKWEEKDTTKDRVETDKEEQKKDPLGAAYLLWP